MGSNLPEAKQPADRTDQMSFLEHLEELRWRIIKGLIGIVVGVIIAAIFSDFVIDKVLLGPTKADFFMYEYLRVDSIDLTLQSRKLPGQFFTYWGMLFVSGFIIGSPLFIYQMWAFIEPALETREKWKTLVSAFFISLFFTLGVSFGYFILVPFALQFFANFTISDLGIVRNDFDINEYFSSLAMWVISCGVIFQVPIISYALSKAGFLTPDFLKKYRRHALIVSLVMAALLTPPDPVSQILIAIPLAFLYEFSIVVSRFAVKRREKELKEAFGDTEAQA
ncbi:MAG TPA: twin-arginine translocase subunit TatC [Balneolaceae bacterium]|nr:twin-arginine translocase subunit TatC [Balneolaceae bacterium]|tara:strand:+ start:105504 stop:106343 length:840 start_codon:yes stop_codon:yes gene_type:complete